MLSLFFRKRFLLAALLTFLTTATALPQSFEDGKRLLEEGNQLSDNARSDQQLRNVVTKFEEALRIFEKFKDHVAVSEACNSLGLVYDRWGEFARAMKYFQRSLDVTKAANDTKGQALALNNMAVSIAGVGLYDKAMAMAVESAEISKRQNDVEAAMVTRFIIGQIFYEKGDYLSAIQTYKDVLKHYESENNLNQIARVQNNLGDAYTKVAWLDQALESLEKAISLFKQSNDETENAVVFSNIGVVFETLGALGKAEEYYNQALNSMQKFKNPAAERELLINLGNLARQQNRLDKATKYYQESVSLCKRYNMPDNLPKDMIANVYLDNSQIANAEPLAIEAGYNRTLARLYMAKSDLGMARKYYEKTVAQAQKNLDSNDLFIGCTGLGMIYEKQGQFDKSADFYRKAIDATEEARLSLPQNLAADHFFAIRVGGFRRIDPYKGLSRVLIKLDKGQEALKWSEYSKARLFAESFSRRSGASVSSIPETVLQEDRKLNDELAAILNKRRKAYETNSIEAMGFIDSQVKSSKARLDNHKRMLRDRYPVFAATRYPEPVDINQSLLSGAEWLVVYDVSDPGFIVYLLNGKELVNASFVPITINELSDMVQKTLAPLSVTSLQDFKAKVFDPALVNSLCQKLIGPIIDMLPEKAHLIIVPDDILQSLPFELLLLNSKARVIIKDALPYLDDASFLADRNPISYFQSITALTLSRTLKDSRIVSERILVMADPVFHRKQISSQKPRSLMATVEDSEDLCLPADRLKKTAILAQNLKRLYNDKSDIYERLEASKSNLISGIGPRLKNYRSIIFATHGYYAPDNPYIKEPVLLLSMLPRCVDGYLYQSEILALKVNADVVALTACQTGTGKIVPGEGTMSLGRAFQFAGARSVIMSLWNVEEQASVDLVSEFFRHLNEGKTRLEALNLARRYIRNSGYEHPYFWSSFILVGEVN